MTNSARTNHGHRTGEHCPVTGWWVRNSGPAEPRFLIEGSLMPAADGEAASWLLTNAVAPGQVLRAGAIIDPK